MTTYPRDTNLTPPAKNPCLECPFNRNVKPGTLGGSPITTYIGQIYGPFLLTCHMQTDFTDPAWNKSAAQAETPQCVGAAIMRANLYVQEIMPPPLRAIHFERDVERVFTNMTEFAMHHGGISMIEAAALTSTRMIRMLLADQMMRQARGMKA